MWGKDRRGKKKEGGRRGGPNAKSRMASKEEGANHNCQPGKRKGTTSKRCRREGGNGGTKEGSAVRLRDGGEGGGRIQRREGIQGKFFCSEEFGKLDARGKGRGALEEGREKEGELPQHGKGEEGGGGEGGVKNRFHKNADANPSS